MKMTEDRRLARSMIIDFVIDHMTDYRRLLGSPLQRKTDAKRSSAPALHCVSHN